MLLCCYARDRFIKNAKHVLLFSSHGSKESISEVLMIFLGTILTPIAAEG